MIRTCEVPSGALLHKYGGVGAYADCYVTDIARSVTQTQYIEAFYSTWIFKLERLLLAWLVAKPSTDLQATALAAGTSEAFAAWHVEVRTADQLLMCDFQGRTRSWLMSADAPDSPNTRLYFGSAVVAANTRRSGRRELGWLFRALLGFHKVYSRLLLRAAVSRLLRPGATIGR